MPEIFAGELLVSIVLALIKNYDWICEQQNGGFVEYTANVFADLY